MDPSLLYQAIAARQVDVITAYSSDGRIDAAQMRRLNGLVDERHLSPTAAARVFLAAPAAATAEGRAGRD